MLRFVLYAVVLAGSLAMVHPSLGDPRVATAFDHSQAAAAATVHLAPRVHASHLAPRVHASPSPSSSDAGVPASAGSGADFIPIGFGWG
jgi:hypothetical protein